MSDVERNGGRRSRRRVVGVTVVGLAIGSLACGRTWEIGPQAGTDGGAFEEDCPLNLDDRDLSLIWIANSQVGAVSKIDTDTGVELARYRSGPGTDDQPSRTSVNLMGDAVVVNRGPDGGAGGITKIAANAGRCVDRNGNGVIDTSTGAGDVLPWGADECVLWHQTVPSRDYTDGPRPVAWDARTPDPRVWVGWYESTPSSDRRGWFRRLDGETGETLDEIQIPWSSTTMGPYGGAMDGNGDFWAVGWFVGPLVRIDGETLEVDRYEVPEPHEGRRFAYGMALDERGRPWIASGGSALVFDPNTETWDSVLVGPPDWSMYGVAADAQGRVWLAIGLPVCGLAVIDSRTMQLLHRRVDLGLCKTPVGVSVDAGGYVWVVDRLAGVAFKVDPDTHEVVLRVEGLVGPYTYSDMTGYALALANRPGCDD